MRGSAQRTKRIQGLKENPKRQDHAASAVGSVFSASLGLSPIQAASECACWDTEYVGTAGWRGGEHYRTG
jgi:hypothetical protein